MKLWLKKDEKKVMHTLLIGISYNWKFTLKSLAPSLKSNIFVSYFVVSLLCDLKSEQHWFWELSKYKPQANAHMNFFETKYRYSTKRFILDLFHESDQDFFCIFFSFYSRKFFRKSFCDSSTDCSSNSFKVCFFFQNCSTISTRYSLKRETSPEVFQRFFSGISPVIHLKILEWSIQELFQRFLK